MKLLVDVNLSPRRVELLGNSGIEAVHWLSVGAHDADDIDIFDWCRRNDYVVLTRDLDFGAILAATRGAKPSVVQIRSVDVSPDVIGKALVFALLQLVAKLEAGALLTIDPKRTRLRELPF